MFTNGGNKMYWHLFTYLSKMEISFYSYNIRDMNPFGKGQQQLTLFFRLIFFI